ncbi:MAG: redoxin domain-containing protein, partial [Pirellula sp.]|nr:redoxin domain-containing protein [Pirellula sp.]
MNFRFRPTIIAAMLFVITGASGSNGTQDSLRAEDPPAKLSASAKGLIGQKVSRQTLTDYQGRDWDTSEFQNQKGVVFAFLGTQCPLAKLYSVKIVALAKEYESRGIRFVAVDSNVQDSLAEMAAHAKKFEMT